MTISAPGGEAMTLTGVVSAARESLEQASNTVWAFKTRTDVLAAAAELERTRSRVYALEAIAAVEIEDTDAAKDELGWASVKDFLTFTIGGLRGCGGKLLHTARTLVDERPRTWQALYDGLISPEKADVIVRVIDDLPVDTSVREAAEELLLLEARELDATELKIAGNSLLEAIDPDGVAKREEKKL
ncbi:MAG: DUF222 domain-containing protein, partial [Nocardioides sp.]